MNAYPSSSSNLVHHNSFSSALGHSCRWRVVGVGVGRMDKALDAPLVAHSPSYSLCWNVEEDDDRDTDTDPFYFLDASRDLDAKVAARFLCATVGAHGDPRNFNDVEVEECIKLFAEPGMVVGDFKGGWDGVSAADAWVTWRKCVQGVLSVREFLSEVRDNRTESYVVTPQSVDALEMCVTEVMFAVLNTLFVALPVEGGDADATIGTVVDAKQWVSLCLATGRRFFGCTKRLLLSLLRVFGFKLAQLSGGVELVVTAMKTAARDVAGAYDYFSTDFYVGESLELVTQCCVIHPQCAAELLLDEAQLLDVMTAAKNVFIGPKCVQFVVGLAKCIDSIDESQVAVAVWLVCSTCATSGMWEVLRAHDTELGVVEVLVSVGLRRPVPMTVNWKNVVAWLAFAMTPPEPEFKPAFSLPALHDQEELLITDIDLGLETDADFPPPAASVTPAMVFAFVTRCQRPFLVLRDLKAKIDCSTNFDETTFQMMVVLIENMRLSLDFTMAEVSPFSLAIGDEWIVGFGQWVTVFGIAVTMCTSEQGTMFDCEVWRRSLETLVEGSVMFSSISGLTHSRIEECNLIQNEVAVFILYRMEKVCPGLVVSIPNARTWMMVSDKTEQWRNRVKGIGTRASAPVPVSVPVPALAPVASKTTKKTQRKDDIVPTPATKRVCPDPVTAAPKLPRPIGRPKGSVNSKGLAKARQPQKAVVSIQPFSNTPQVKPFPLFQRAPRQASV